LNRSSLPWHGDFLTNISDFNVNDLALLVDNPEVIFVNLENQPQILHTIVVNEVVSSVLTVDTLAKKTRSSKSLIGVLLLLDVV